MFCWALSWFYLLCPIEFFLWVWCDKLGMVHCIYWGVTGYNFLIKMHFFCWRLFCHSKQCRPWWNAALCGVSSGSSLFAKIGLHSAVGSVSDCRYASDCNIRGHELDPGPVPYLFKEIDHEIISTTILLPSTDSRRVVVSYKQKYVHEVLACPGKSVVRWTDRPDMTISDFARPPFLGVIDALFENLGVISKFRGSELFFCVIITFYLSAHASILKVFEECPLS